MIFVSPLRIARSVVAPPSRARRRFKIITSICAGKLDCAWRARTRTSSSVVFARRSGVLHPSSPATSRAISSSSSSPRALRRVRRVARAVAPIVRRAECGRRPAFGVLASSSASLNTRFDGVFGRTARWIRARSSSSDVRTFRRRREGTRATPTATTTATTTTTTTTTTTASTRRPDRARRRASDGRRRRRRDGRRRDSSGEV